MVADNLLEVIGCDTQLKYVASTNGGEHAGSCPFCGGEDRFRVWPNHNGGRWWCRQCEKSGDLVSYQVEMGQIDKAQAYRLRHGDPVEPARKPTKTAKPAKPIPESERVDRATPPDARWQKRAFDLVAQAQNHLWGDVAPRALGWLRNRGLSDDTIRAGGLGYNPQDIYEPRADWGLPDGKKIWLPRGVVIPWFIGTDIWRVNIRRPVKPGEEPKCVGPAGFTQGLYESDRIRFNKPALLLEGEIDALTVLQVAGDLVTPVATGGTGGARCARWVAKLALCPLVLVSFDADEAGEQARQWWLRQLKNGRYWRPYWSDANAMFQAGVDLRAWVITGLGLK